jgi:outer membrane lipoprotein-sorting protein
LPDPIEDKGPAHVNILRRLPLSRLLLLCGVVVAVGTGATALALAVGSGPTPPPKPLAEAVHDALTAPKADGVSARIQLTNHLIEGASLASGGGEASQLAASPLLSGGSGRLWIGSEGHARLELQSEKGDTQILYDGNTASMYDASTNTLYRYTPQTEAAGGSGGPTSGETGSTGAKPDDNKIPTVAEIEEGIAHAGKQANVSGATPGDVAGQAAYTVRVTPREDGGLIGGAELSWDAVHGAPLRAAVYSTTSTAPVIELAATEISYGPVDSSTLDFKPPTNAKVEDVTLPTKHASGSSSSGSNPPHVTTHGKGLGAIALVESPVKAGSGESVDSQLEGLQKVSIGGTSASELPTALGTLLTFERSGVRYLLAGSVTPASIEAFARGL